MQSFDILDPKLNIFQSRFLEASAGTGKTFAIEHLVLRLILESKKPISLKEILAVTFTKEAAHEMKMRIRKKLESQTDKRAKEALATFDEIQVFTIHGFCHRMLSEFAFEAKTSLQISSPDQPDHLLEMNKTVTDFFQTGDPQFATDVEALLKKNRYDLDRTISQIVDAMQKDLKVETFRVPDFPKVSSDHLRSDFYQLAPRYKRFNPENYENQLEKFTTFTEEKNPTLLLEEKEWFFEKMCEDNVKVRAQTFESHSLKLPSLFKILETKLIPALNTLRNPEQILARIAQECQKRWLVKASRHDHFTFDDLLHKMKKALDEPLFKEKVQAKYKAVIVDEFQDTDPIQWAIFEKLFLENHLLYLVGDPKQSIYGFRNADIYTYMKAADALGKENKVFLDTNYRSSPPLIEKLNQLFTQREDWIDLPTLPGSLKYHPVKPGRSDTKLDEDPLIFFGAKGEIGRGRSFPTKQMEEEKLFPYIAREILRLQPKIPLSEITILIKDRFQAQRMQLYLNRWKIPSTVKRTFNLAETNGFLEMEILLRAVKNPDDDRAVSAALPKAEMNPFHELKKLFLEKGFAAFFTHYIDSHFHSSNIPLFLEMRQTAEVLMQLLNASPSELLHFISDLKTKNPEIDPRLKLRGEEGEDKVSIMTTFASKGLEFDVVFALGLAYRGAETNKEQDAEKMRQLYVALTRAREKLYIPFVLETSKKETTLSQSPIELFFQDHIPSVNWIEEIPFTPWQKGKNEFFIIRKPPKLNLKFDEKYLTSFSAMAKSHSTTLLGERFRLQDLSEKTSHTLPLGAETGTIIHEIFEKHFEDRQLPIEQIVFETLNGTHLEGWEEVISDMASQVIQMPLEKDFSLEQLQDGDYFQEMEFLFPRENQLVTGFIDLIFRRGNTFYILDWKTNWVGPSDDDYTEENLKKVMQEHDYYLQANFYQEAVIRYVKRLYTNPQFGGAYYIFVRGKKAVHFGTC